MHAYERVTQIEVIECQFPLCISLICDVTMTTTLNTSCSENTMVLSARRRFLHARIF